PTAEAATIRVAPPTASRRRMRGARDARTLFMSIASEPGLGTTCEVHSRDVSMTAAAQEQRRPSALSSYNARLFLGGTGLSHIGTFSQIVAQSLLVLDLTDSGIALGAVMAAQAVPMLVLAPWAGPLLDRWRLRRVMVCTALLGAAQAASLAILA